MKNKQKNKWLKAISVALSCALLATAAPVGVLAEEITNKVDLDIEVSNSAGSVDIAEEDLNVIWSYLGADTITDEDEEAAILNENSGVYVNKENSMVTEWGMDTDTALGCVYEVALYGMNFSRDDKDVLVIDEFEHLSGVLLGYNTEEDLLEYPSMKLYAINGFYPYNPYGISLEGGLDHDSLGSDIINAVQNEGMPEYDMYFVEYKYLTEDGDARWQGMYFMMEGTETVLKFVEDKTEEGSCGDTATYTLDSNGLLTISGEGAISEEAFMDNTSITSVVIEDGITGIGYAAFSGCSNLTNIDIANSVTVISSNAFSGCSKLTDIVIPDGVTEIWNEAFSGCSSLVSVKLPNSLEYWGNDVFAYCTSLPSIVIPDGIDRVNHRDFGNCTSLTSVFIPESVTDIRSEAFLNCDNLTDIYYAGTEAQWNEVEKGYYSGDEYFGCGIPDTATIHFESTGLDDSANDTENDNTENDTEDDNDAINDSYEVDCSGDNTSISASDFAAILEKNKTKDVVIKSNNGVSFTFAKGTMSEVGGMENYDFGTTLVSDFANAGKMDSSVTKDNFVARINYNYSGKLPATASIKIYVGTDYANQTLYYSQILENGFKYIQSVKVDAEGYVTVTQDHCSDYVLATEKLDTTVTTETPDNTEKDTTSPKTGDSSNIILYVMMVVFGTGIVAVGMRRKFHN